MRFLLILLILLPGILSAQNTENTAWLAFMNSTRFNQKWGAHLDVQLRSSDEYKSVKGLLIRPGISYFLSKRSTATLGYLLNESYTGVIAAPDLKLTEHRIWEQFNYSHKLKNTSLAHRFRLEQRFIERPSGDVFAQRLRYFLRSVSPLAKQDSAFARGAFLASQNELFLNVQHKNKLNGSFFDQNRAYIALGYRFSKKLDAELGYLNQAVKGASLNTSNNVLQAVLYTKF